MNDPNAPRVRFYTKTGPLPKQKEFHGSRAKKKLYYGGFGSGKTKAGCWEVFMLSMQFPGTEGVICRNTYPELRDTTRKAFFLMLAEITEEITGEYGDPFDPTSCPLVTRYSKVENSLALSMGEGCIPSIVLFRSLDAFEKFKSGEYGWVYIDEASDTQEEPFLILSGRLRHPAQAGHYCIFLTTNPCNTQHWIYKRFVKGFRDKDELKNEYAAFQAPTSENVFLPDGYEDDLRRSYPEAWVDRYVSGEFGILPEGKPVYPEFSKKNVCKVKYVPGITLVRSWDFGSHHPACVIAQIHGNRLAILASILGHDELINVFAARVLKFCRENYGTEKAQDSCDPAGHQKNDKSRQTSVQVLNGFGVFPKSSPQRILDGVLVVSMLLQESPNDDYSFCDDEEFSNKKELAGLIIDPSCGTLIDGFYGGYHYPKKYLGQGEDPLPVKDGVYDHEQDDLRYLIGNNFPFKNWFPRKDKQQQDENSFEAVRKRIIQSKSRR